MSRTALGVVPEDCLVFEDVPAGILAGKRAGMTVCAVEDEFSRHMEAEEERVWPTIILMIITNYYKQKWS